MNWHPALLQSPPKRYHRARQPGWGQDLRLARRGYKSSYRSWVRARRPHNPDNPHRQAYKSAKKTFRTHLRLHRKYHHETFLNSLDTNLDPRKFFQCVWNQTSPRSSLPATNRITVNGISYSENITDGWANYFERLSTPPPTTEHLLPDLYRALSSIPNTEPDWTTPEVLNIIRSLPHNKATDEVIAPILCTLFNVILFSGHIPGIFHHGIIILIPKDRNLYLTNPFNFRGITLLSAISKVFEKILLLRLIPLISSLHPLQGGFISGRSPLHTAFVLQESILWIQERKKKAFVAFLDLK